MTRNRIGIRGYRLAGALVAALAVALAAVGAPAKAPAKPAPLKKGDRGLHERERAPGYANPDAWYHLWVPANYSPNKPTPFYMFLHGGHVGAGTADNVVSIRVVVPKLKESLVLFPNHLYWFWSHPDESVYVMTILEEVLKSYNVDRKRMYVLGSSMGGTGTMHFAARFPEMWAACAPISCWCEFIPVEKAGVMPIFSAHGKRDNVVPIKWSHDIQKRLQGVPNLQFERRELDYEHNAPTSVFVEATEWMSKFQNPRTFDIAEMKKRAAALPLESWMKNAKYQQGYLNANAWALLTCPDKSLRDPVKALSLAEEANRLSGSKDSSFLDTLALAYFQNRRVKEAVETQKKAVSLLPANTPADARKDMEERLKQFEKGVWLDGK